MAISFIAISKGLGLYDFIQFGKYKGCRVDSILAQDPEYVSYTKEKFGTLYSQEVLEKIEGSMATYAKAKELAERMQLQKQLKVFHGKYDYTTREYEFEDYLHPYDDVPF